MKLKRKKRKEGKVKNATPNEYDGIKFRSKFETYTYKKLKNAGIACEYEKHTYELLPAFTFQGEKIRPITYKPDFVGDNFIIECKGFPNESWPLRLKLFKRVLSNMPQHKAFYIVRTQKEVDNLIEQLLCQNF